MFRLEIERADGSKFFRGGAEPIEWRNPEDADAVAERMWQMFGDPEGYVRFSVIEQDGTVYSEWEV